VQQGLQRHTFYGKLKIAWLADATQGAHVQLSKLLLEVKRYSGKPGCCHNKNKKMNTKTNIIRNFSF
jgi:hypothetical protein